jgi:hypothetical protein
LKISRILTAETRTIDGLWDVNMLEQLRAKVAEYLQGSIPLDRLEDWLISHLQTILDSGDEGAIKSADTLDAALVRLHEGLISEAEFFREAEQLALKPSIFVLAAQVQYFGSTGASTRQSDSSTRAIHPVWDPPVPA